ncbi:MAG: 16S rRNA (adenine(1518)-N(6)/adenine(1519)-N(6))-dimethyltransferase, partial [Gammaproteobacteria bacterium]|nr:16S rRNA (adenine(1518)-N(6)/adenine(1519)-N(6))-dimethyltransferase [Gammaproteobacteria bacterium]
MNDHRPRKRFGQHFLHDRNVVGRIVAALALGADDRVVEIGPGTGALTRELAASLSHFDAVELDRDLIARLESDFPRERLTLHQDDALKFDFCQLAPDEGKLRIIGNLPYNISTPLLFHLLDQAGCIQD